MEGMGALDADRSSSFGHCTVGNMRCTEQVSYLPRHTQQTGGKAKFVTRTPGSGGRILNCWVLP